MSNITSWADASSDEESDDERIAPPPSALPGSSSYLNLQNEDDDDVDHDEDEALQTEADYSFIFENPPPYTAYLGNLSYEMKKSDDFGAEVEKLLGARGCVANTEKGENQPVQLRNARLITDRATGASRGYGYVEFDYPEELISFISLTNPQLCGRNVKVDIATGTRNERGGGGGGGNRRRGENNRNNSGRRDSNKGPRGDGRDSNRRGSEQRQQSQKELPKDVGAQFMGGRYARSDSGRGGGSMRRNDSSVSQGSAGGGGGDAPPRQRPSLKLAPRTKPVDEQPDGGSTKASIFGGARPRDESKFLEKKESSVDDAAVKEATGSMKSMNVKDESGDGKKDSTEAADTKTSEPSEKQPPRRQESKTGGRGGRKDGRRESTRKSGKDGERRGGGRGDKNRGRGEGGRNGKRNSTKSNGDSNEKPQSSLAAAAASGTVAAQAETKKAPPKKTNSFAAFMDDSDED
ncbi:hypothetical protein ACHAWT_001334 [Skeletonema menzelii]|mmetsp:Transcript_14323/g.23477  ORF Transcript_14323/g.23477 Transcript_14323/m.23477 type:complete len:463 (+) Transcript_14323:232-1620(+)